MNNFDSMNMPRNVGGIMLNQKPYDPSTRVLVKDKETGKLISLERRQDFSAKHHEWIPEKESVEVAEAPEVAQASQEVDEGQSDEEQKMYYSLRSKGLKNMTEDEKKAFEILKEKGYGKKK